MISKKRLRERLMDITKSAGLDWQDDGFYWDCFGAENMQRAAYAIRDIFDLQSEDVIHLGYLGTWEDMDSLVDRIHYLLSKQ